MNFLHLREVLGLAGGFDAPPRRVAAVYHAHHLSVDRRAAPDVSEEAGEFVLENPISVDIDEFPLTMPRH